MHTSVVIPLLQSAEVSAEAKRRLADLVVNERKLIAGNFSGPVTTSLIGERPLKTRASRVDGGYRITGRKMFASMLEAADFVLVMPYPDWATSRSAGIILMLPREVDGRSVDPNWDVLGMRATRGDSLILDECWLPDSAALFRSDDTRPFRHTCLKLVLGLVHPSLSRCRPSSVRRVAQSRPHPASRKAKPSPSPITRRTPACRRDECRSRSGAADHLPLGLAQRQGRAHGGNHRRPTLLHGSVVRRRGLDGISGPPFLSADRHRAIQSEPRSPSSHPEAAAQSDELGCL
jgi:hypothetical protein